MLNQDNDTVLAEGDINRDEVLSLRAALLRRVVPSHSVRHTGIRSAIGRFEAGQIDEDVQLDSHHLVDAVFNRRQLTEALEGVELTVDSWQASPAAHSFENQNLEI